MLNVSFFDTKDYDRNFFEKFEGQNGLHFKFYETKLREETIELAKDSFAVCVFVNDDVSEKVIEKLSLMNVKMIALRCAGFNNVDLAAAKGKIKIARVPAYSPYAVAEHTMAMLLCSIRRIHKAYNRTRDFNFRLNGLTGFDLHEKTIGVIGTGKIGQIFIDICKGFKMNILAFDKHPVQIDGIKYVSLDELFEKSNIISLHCPLTEETYHIINKENIERMKKGVIILNTSRGALIDAEDLLEGIKERKIGAACLDVYEEESDLFFEDFSGHIVNDDTFARLLTMPNVLVTSHQAFLTEEALGNIAKTTVENILNFSEKNELKNEVNYDMIHK